MKPSNIINEAKTTVHNLLFCVHTLYVNYGTNTFLLVSSSVRSKQVLCFVHGQGQKGEQKNLQQSTLSSFITIPL